MARPIEYNLDKVLLDAMNLFWEKGYEATSIKDIVEVTGLKPGSLYNLYGNKEGIFDAVVLNYSEILRSQVKTILEKSDSSLESIKNFLHDIVVATILNEKTNGCLLAKTLLVLSSKDKKLQQEITDVFQEVELLLEKTIEKAIANGETKVDPKYFAKFIITNLYGMHAYYKTDNNPYILEQNVKFIIGML